ncbi:MAG: hypothetical protein LR011_02065 [Verrucomicrobia bacterium]|nr:hypothetical protein [Verrucomicrobiota bacterium]
MNILVKIGLYLAVVGVTAFFAWMGYQESQAILAQPNRFDSELTSVQGGPARDAQSLMGKARIPVQWSPQTLRWGMHP